MKTALLFAFALLALAACKKTTTICEASDMACFCRERPADPLCSTPFDGGTDAGDIDAGPCGVCTAPNLHCDDATSSCVECTDDAHCTTGTARTCSAAHQCVECEMNQDCTDPMNSLCDEGTCSPCVENTDCDITGLGVCDTGTCVECTEDDATGCAGNPCTRDNTCSDFGIAQELCEPCDTDENCGGAPSYCVPMRYMGVDRPGGYCLTGGTPPTCERPYSIALTGRTTLSEEGGLTFCGINEMLATCEAVRALVEDATCPGGTDDECPQPSGLCRRVGALMNRCTYACSGAASECIDPPTAGSTCDNGGAGAGDYCGG
jgi:hypothetical protein